MRNAPVIEVSVQPEGSPKVRVDVSDVVISFEYEDCENKADKLSLTIDNWNLGGFDDPIWRKGNRVIVSWGYPEAMAVERVCQIRKVTGFQQLKIEALGKEVELNVETKVRAFEGMSRSDVAVQIAHEWGFVDEELLHIQSTKLPREHIAQARMTDAQFLRRLAQKEGFEWYIDHDGFHFHERNFFQRSLRVLTWFDDPDTSEIQEISVENDVTRRAGSVTVKSHNPLQRLGLEVAASNETDKARAVLGDVMDAPGKPEKGTPGFGSIAHDAVHHTTEPDAEAAKRHASALFRGAQQRAVKLSLTIEGDPNIYAKSVIEIGGIGKRLSQLYYVRTVTHTIDGTYTTKITCVSDGTGGHSTKSALAHEASAVQVGPKVQGKRPPLDRIGLETATKAAPAASSGADAAEAPRQLVGITRPDGSTGYVKRAASGVPGVDSSDGSALSSVDPLASTQPMESISSDGPVSSEEPPSTSASSSRQPASAEVQAAVATPAREMTAVEIYQQALSHSGTESSESS